MEQAGQLLTPGDLLRECKVTRAQLNYALSEYDITPQQRAGIVRLYRPDQLPTIKAALSRINGRREVFAHA